MKKILCLAVLIASLLGPARAAFADLEDVRHHKQWTSAILPSEEGPSVRIFTQDDKKESILAVDFFPRSVQNRERLYLLKIIVGRTEVGDEPRSFTVPGRMQIDRGPVYAVKYSMMTDPDEWLYAIMKGEMYPTFLREAMKGLTAIFEVAPKDGQTYYSSFTLLGFTSALKRAETLLEGLEKRRTPRR